MLRAKSYFVLAGLVLASAVYAAAQSGSEPPVIQPHRSTPSKTPQKSAARVPQKEAELLLSCDIACTITFDGEAKGRMDADGSIKVKGSAGQHLVMATAEGSVDHALKTVDLDQNRQVVLRIELKAIRDARVQAEQAARQQQEQARVQEETRKQQNRTNAKDTYYKALSYYNNEDYERAMPLLNQSCEGGYTDACGQLGFSYTYHKGVAEDFVKARAFLKIACDAGNGQDCDTLANLYQEGKGGDADQDVAHAIFEKSCQLKYYLGCYNLGEWYSSVQHDESKAIQSYDRGCDGGYEMTCVTLGYRYEHGRGVDQNYSRAFQYYKRACDSSAIWCDRLARMYEEGIGVSRDAYTAHNLYQKACKDGATDACSK